MLFADYGLHEAMRGQAPDPNILAACLDLFRGHPVPALWSNGTWRPAPNTSRRTAFRAHLLGVARAGSYPFLGVPVDSCRCGKRQHTCDGLGTDYFCLDLDDHDSTGGMLELTGRTLGAVQSAGFRPLSFTSQSGTGTHVFVFLDSALPTRQVHAAASTLMRRAGVSGRCDILPSARHATGFGTLHALPLHPGARERGGGILLDGRLRPVEGAAVIDVMRGAHHHRSPAGALLSVDTGPLTEAVRGAAPAERVGRDRGTAASLSDAAILRMMQRRHPQFRRALQVENGWRGGRSARDSVLAGQMLRQGMTTRGVAEALVSLPGTKAGARGIEYALALVEGHTRCLCEPDAPLAGVPRGSLLRATPWAGREPPPLDYGGERNPWWEPDIQQRLRASRTRRVDRIVLAYIIDRWFRGPIQRRMYFLGHRDLAAALGMPTSTVSAAVRRIMAKYSDVVRIVAGVPHPRLRLATAFDVVGARSNDVISWYLTDIGAGQSRGQPVYSTAEDDGCDHSVTTGDGSGAGVARSHVSARPAYDPSRSGEQAESGPDVDTDRLQRRGKPRGVLAGARWLAPCPEGLPPDTGRRLPDVPSEAI